MNWLLIYEIIYMLVLIFVCLRIIYDTRNNTKTWPICYWRFLFLLSE